MLIFTSRIQIQDKGYCVRVSISHEKEGGGVVVFNRSEVPSLDRQGVHPYGPLSSLLWEMISVASDVCRFGCVADYCVGSGVLGIVEGVCLVQH